MHIITTIFFAETKEPFDRKHNDGPFQISDLRDSERQWVSIYEGKNRVEPIDQND
jgi:hypothetical protein